MTRFAIIVLLAGCLILLNLFPPEHLTIDPWLCRSDAGAENIRNWGWPQIVVTEFNEIGGNATVKHRMIESTGVAINLVAACFLLAMAEFFLRRGKGNSA